MTMKTKNVPEHMTKPVEEVCAEKWLRGVQEHRNGDPAAPFKGNILEEIAHELADLENYLKEDSRTVGDTNWSLEISYFRMVTNKVRAVYFRRLGV